jgi:hypothetical protein
MFTLTFDKNAKKADNAKAYVQYAKGDKVLNFVFPYSITYPEGPATKTALIDPSKGAFVPENGYSASLANYFNFTGCAEGSGNIQKIEFFYKEADGTYATVPAPNYDALTSTSSYYTYQVLSIPAFNPMTEDITNEAQLVTTLENGDKLNPVNFKVTFIKPYSVSVSNITMKTLKGTKASLVNKVSIKDRKGEEVYGSWTVPDTTNPLYDAKTNPLTKIVTGVTKYGSDSYGLSDGDITIDYQLPGKYSDDVSFSGGIIEILNTFTVYENVPQNATVTVNIALTPSLTLNRVATGTVTLLK